MTQNISAPAVSTTQSGAPVTSDAHSKSVGADGAIAYNTTYRVLAVCSGNVWRAAGRVGGKHALIAMCDLKTATFTVR